MGRMLDALKQLETRTSAEAFGAHPGADSDATLTEPRHPTDAEPSVGELSQVASQAKSIRLNVVPPSVRGNHTAGGQRFLGTSDPLACSQYRQLARVILSQLPIGSNEPVLITGARDCQDIEQLAAGLGSAMAELFPGQILLVDAVSGKAVSGKSDRGAVFGPSESAGWTEVDVGHPEEVRSAIRATDVEGVWHLPSRSNKDSYSGGVPYPPKSGILLRKALAELADQYGLILLFADQASWREIGEILPWCVATYVAIEIGSTTVEDALSALSDLSQAGAQLHGFIATHADSVDRLVGVS